AAEAGQADDAARAERVGGWSVGIVVADQVHADLQVLEDRVVERVDREPPIGAVYEIVRRAVVGLGRRHWVEAHGRLHQHVTEAREYRVPQVAPPRGPPEVHHA